MASAAPSVKVFQTEAAQKVIDQYARSKVESGEAMRYRYGTAGFRGPAVTLESVMCRMGFLAVLRSLVKGGPAVGVMITASHNPEQDNGVKIVDPSGDMLEGDWEKIATDLANATEAEALATFDRILSEQKSGEITSESTATVFVGRDTRPHSAKFSAILEEATQTVGCRVAVRDFGEVTTPQLHYYTGFANKQTERELVATPAKVYMSNITASFASTLELFAKLKGLSGGASAVSAEESIQLTGELVVDCANGVGGIVLSELAAELGTKGTLKVSCVNLPGVEGVKVNDDCGAEFVHKKRKVPAAFKPLIASSLAPAKSSEDKSVPVRFASVDGDCDRLMYFYLRSMDGDASASEDESKQEMRILDGDKQICLMYSMVEQLIAKCGFEAGSISVGVAQTGYANGAAVKYIRETLKTEPVFTKTGVKHLHHKAITYDCSIYFEANGHGTMLINQSLADQLTALIAKDETTDEQRLAAQALLQLRLLANQNVGDALADILICELALFLNGWSLRDWDDIYEDYPSVLTAIRVSDRQVFETTNAEQTCVKPAEIQPRIDELCAAIEGGRAFVRPSGTEDIVRVYAEAAGQEDAARLNLETMRAVYDFAAGVGDRP